jgi:hypothetical protein
METKPLPSSTARPAPVFVPLSKVLPQAFAIDH